VQLTLYVDGYFVNQFDASCMIAMTEKALPFSTARALLRDGGGVPVALSTRTGISRVPAFQHGDFYLTKSMAIIEYLEETFPPPAYTRLLPAEPHARARARQIMAFVRIDQRQLRAERAWWMTVYPAEPGPLSAEAEQDARELLEFTMRLSSDGELDEWNIAHSDLALTLYRLARTDYPLPLPVQRFLDVNLVRPSLRAYLDHPRPPNPPPRALATG
jgi:glutathione S-transferase